MQIDCIAYGIAKDILGARRNHIEIGEINTVGALKDFLKAKYPKLNQLQHFQIAINESYATDKELFNEKDEIVIIPPVSGG